MNTIMNAPELEWLKGNVNGTPEGESASEMEFKRTKLSLDLLKMVLERNYEDFTACQKDDVKLSRESFAEIQQYTRSTLKNNADIYAMQAYLIINDLGKIVSFVKQVEAKLHLQSVDHDELLYEGLKQMKTYLKLPVQVKEMLTKELTKDGINNKGILLYYVPATLSNAINYFKKNGDINAISNAMNVLLPIFANIYGLTKAKICNYKSAHGVCTAFIADVAEKAKKPLEMFNYKVAFENVNNDFYVRCEPIEQIKVNVTEKTSIISGSNVVVVVLGGGSDCIQAAMVGKFLLKGCKNVISIRTKNTSSQNEKGEMNKQRKISNPKEVLAEGVYLCDIETNGEGRFFENMPSQIGMNSYLVIDEEDGKLFSKIQTVIEHIRKNVGDNIDTILGVDTGGDCLYPIKKDSINAETTPDQDRTGLEAIMQFENLGFKVFNCIVAPGIDSPNGITTEILTKANAIAYLPTAQESEEILEMYYKWNMTGKDVKKFGKTSLIWQAALKKKRGLVTVNIPLQNVLSDDNPWIPTVTITDISEMIIFMKTSNCINAIKCLNKMQTLLQICAMGFIALCDIIKLKRLT